MTSSIQLILGAPEELAGLDFQNDSIRLFQAPGVDLRLNLDQVAWL